MKRVLLCVLAAALSVAPGCKDRKAVPVRQTVEESAARLASTIHMGDPQAAGQLTGGFHSIENSSWRWTEQRFTVALGPPPDAGQKGASLELNLAVPAVTIEKLHSITLSAAIEGTTFPPETYTAPGSYSYKRDVPPGLLTRDVVIVGFRLDKAIPPSELDLRELGVVVSSVALEPK
jgi:hypothetical protein